MKIRLTAVSTGPGEADVIAHIPARSTAAASYAGYRARVARAVRQGEPGRPWVVTLYAKAYELSQGVPAVPATMATVRSETAGIPGRRERHTLAGVMGQLRERGQWWSA